LQLLPQLLTFLEVLDKQEQLLPLAIVCSEWELSRQQLHNRTLEVTFLVSRHNQLNHLYLEGRQQLRLSQLAGTFSEAPKLVVYLLLRRGDSSEEPSRPSRTYLEARYLVNSNSSSSRCLSNKLRPLSLNYRNSSRWTKKMCPS
jgi:hypothetical protein